MCPIQMKFRIYTQNKLIIGHTVQLQVEENANNFKL